MGVDFYKELGHSLWSFESVSFCSLLGCCGDKKVGVKVLVTAIITNIC